MRILHLSTPTSWRGGEQQVAYLMQQLEHKELEQFILCAKGGAMETYCQQNNIRYFSKKKGSSFNLFFARYIKSLCTQLSIDLLHIHDSHGHNLAVLAADIWQNKTPMILARRVDFPIRNKRYSVYKYNHPKIPQIICVSNAIQNILAEKVKDPNRLLTIHSGIDLQRFQNIRSSNILRETYQIPNNELLIGNVAALAPHKDYPTFLRTAHLLKTKYQLKAKYCLIGEGKERASIEQLISDLGMKNEVILTGFRNDIEQILPELDIFLFTSETEGLGTSLLDAIACQVPIVATQAGGVPEIIIHQKTGLLAPIKDTEALAKSVLQLRNDEGLKTQIIEGANSHLQAFTIDSLSNKTHEVYKKFLYKL